MQLLNGHELMGVFNVQVRVILGRGEGHPGAGRPGHRRQPHQGTVIILQNLANVAEDTCVRARSALFNHEARTPFAYQLTQNMLQAVIKSPS